MEGAGGREGDRIITANLLGSLQFSGGQQSGASPTKIKKAFSSLRFIGVACVPGSKTLPSTLAACGSRIEAFERTDLKYFKVFVLGCINTDLSDPGLVLSARRDLYIIELSTFRNAFR